MDEAIETTETVADIAKDFARDAAVGAVQTAAGVVLAVAVLAAAGAVIQKLEARKAKKAAAEQQ